MTPKTLDTLSDPCPKLGGLGGATHTVYGKPVRFGRDGRRKASCRYCSRTIDLGPDTLRDRWNDAPCVGPTGKHSLYDGAAGGLVCVWCHYGDDLPGGAS